MDKTAPARGRPEPGARRLGPRPLPLHLGAAAMTWGTSLGALKASRNGSLPWRPELRAAAADLQAGLASADPELLADAIQGQVRQRLAGLADGILAYRRHPYRRSLSDPPVLWSEGTTRLLDYGATAPAGGKDDATPLLVVPSLINRAYVLDLTAETSLLRWLAGQGLRPLLVDWGRPGPQERRFTLTDYIAGRLEAALEAAVAAAGPRMLLLGYCMGGLLALPLALRRPELFSGLALLATPWDFHAAGAAQAALAASAAVAMEPIVEALGELPVDSIQTLFAALDPMQVPRKFLGFAGLEPASSKARFFVALEDWVNDGVPLAAPVARECLGGWYGGNSPQAGSWRIAGVPVDPTKLRLPSLCVIPAADRIVPPASAEALAAMIPGAERLNPPLGHIGMVVGSRAPKAVWAPLLTWLKAPAQGAS